MKIFIINKRQILFGVIGILFIILLAFVLLKSPVEEVFKDDVYYTGDKDEKIVSFLCNVDWGNEYIPTMLEIFNEGDINITFSPTGRWANDNPELLKEMVNHNHEIANHGYNHIDHDKLNYEDNLDAISKAHDTIQDIIGKPPRYFGPPSGAYNEDTVKAAKDLGYTVIMWSVDTIDWREDSTKEVIVDRVTKDINPSDIILMHPTGETVKALPEIIEFLFENGYKIGTISDVIN